MRRRVGEPDDYLPIDTLEELAEGAGWGCVDGASFVALGAAASDRADGAVWARAALDEALARLPAPEREILVLRELEGLSGEEAARVLGLTLAAAKSRLHRARLHLAATLRASHPEGLHD